MAVTGTTGGRVFAFSPYFIKVDGLTAGTGYVELKRYVGGVLKLTLKRYANSAGEVIFPLSGVFRSYFSDVEFGDVLPSIGYVNTASKLISIDATTTNISLSINGGADTAYYYSVIWGALQIGEIESEVETIYAFGDLPLTITQNIGNTIGDNNDAIDYFNPNIGSDVDVAKVIESDALVNIMRFMTSPSTINKTFNIIKSTCTDGIYLRWIDIHGDYKYYLIPYGGEDLSSKLGKTFNYYPLSLEANATTGLYKGLIQSKSKTVDKVISCGESAANDEITLMYDSLLKSLKQYMYLGDGKWLEVNLADMTIGRKRLEGTRQIDVKIALPTYYTQSL